MNTQEILATYDHQLSIREYIEAAGHNVDAMYVDKFWNSIADDKWLYIGEEMLKWIGYESIDHFKLKERYIKLLSSHFTADVEYRHLSASEMKNLFSPLKGGKEISASGASATAKIQVDLPADFNTHNKVKHLIVSPDCFKESLMLMQTNRAKEIRKYYLSLEKVYKGFMTYAAAYKDNELTEVKASLQNAIVFKTIVSKRHTLRQDQYVYVATSPNYARQNLFKIGTTKSLSTRMSGYQTGRASDDHFSYVFMMRCVNGEQMEKLVFSRLEHFRHEDGPGGHKRELFQIHYDLLMQFMREFEAFENESTIRMNNALTKYYDGGISAPAKPYEEIVGVEEVPESPYVPPIVLEPSPFSLTTETVNERLLPFGVQLVGEYTGRGDVPQAFRCLSVMNHVFSNTYEEVYRYKGCALCGKRRILETAAFYSYADRTYDHVATYATFNELKAAEPGLNHQLLLNIIREERWLTTHEGRVYSILSPHDGKLDLNKPLTTVEQFVINALDIDYELMKRRILGSHMKFVIAIDEVSNRAYVGNNHTHMSRKLTFVGSAKPINRKTVAKYIDSGKKYGGYLWVQSATKQCSPYDVIDVESL